MKDRMIHLKARGISLFVDIMGDGYPVLLMHGGPGADHSTMLPFIQCVDEFKLIFYDHRCNGRSVGPNVSTMNWENLTADAEALRETLGIKRWAVVGHSFGGMVALEYAIRYPQHLSHLCIIDTGGDARVVQENAHRILYERGYGNRTVKTAQRFFSGQIAETELIKSMMILGRAYYSDPNLAFMLREALHGLRIHSNPAAFIFGFSKLLPGWSVMKKLKDIKTQTLVIAGLEDFQFPPEHQKHIAKGIENAQLKIVKGAGHNAHIEKTDEVVAMVRQFLRT